MKRIVPLSWTKYLLPMHPVVYISTISNKKIDNIGAFATCVDVGYTPPILSFASTKIQHSVHDSNIKESLIGPQDTFININENKKFIVNIPSINLSHTLNIIGVPSESTEDEFKTAQLMKKPGFYFTNYDSEPKIISECIAHLECEVIEIVDIPLCDHYIIFGEVKCASINENLGNNLIEIRDNLIKQVFGNLRAASANTRYIGKISKIEVTCKIFKTDSEII